MTGYRLDGPCIESRCGRDFPHVSSPALGPTQPPASAVGHERVELYFYSLYGPYGLYRASVPLQAFTLPLPYLVIKLTTESCVSFGHVILGSSLFDLRLPFQCPRQLSPYNDWLRVGRSGNRVQVEARFSAPVQTGPGDHPASSTMGTGSFLGVKSGRGVTLPPHPLLVPLVMKE